MTVTTTVWILLGIAVLAVLYAASLYNNLVSKRNKVKNSWSQIDVQLKRRHDLVPNLVEAVKGFLAHEKAVLDRVAEARQAAMAAGDDVGTRAAAENQLTGALRQLFALTEAYPDLRSSQNMLTFQEELTSTENRIAFARQHYGDSVERYNTARESFPGSLLAGGFEAGEPFAIELDEERAVPEVAFS